MMTSDSVYTYTGIKGEYVPRDVTKVVVDPSVRVIRDGAFWECSSLSSINLPPSLTRIGDGAFAQCVSLSSIDLPASITTIGDEAFRRCTSLVSLDLPPSLTTIGNRTFYGCSSLLSVVLPPLLTRLSCSAFSNCHSLSCIHLPPTLSTVGMCAFYGCESLAVIEIRETRHRVHRVNAYAFERCTHLLQKSATIAPTETSTVDKGLRKLLLNRFRDLPLHRICSEPTVSLAQIDCYCLRAALSSSPSFSDNKSALMRTDAFGMTALHVLVCNWYATVDMVERLLGAFALVVGRGVGADADADDVAASGCVARTVEDEVGITCNDLKNNKYSVLHYALKSCGNSSINTSSTPSSSFEIVKVLLNYDGAGANQGRH